MVEEVNAKYLAYAQEIIERNYLNEKIDFSLREAENVTWTDEIDDTIIWNIVKANPDFLESMLPAVNIPPYAVISCSNEIWLKEHLFACKYSAEYKQQLHKKMCIMYKTNERATIEHITQVFMQGLMPVYVSDHVVIDEYFCRCFAIKEPTNTFYAPPILK